VKNNINIADCKKEIERLEEEVAQLDLENIRLRQEAKIYQHNELKLHEVQRIASTGGWEFDRVTDTFKCTAELAEILEVDTKCLPTWESFLLLTHPEERSRLEEALQESIVSKKSFEIEHRLELSNGKIKYIKHFCKSFCASNGMVINSIGLVQDITNLKNAEKQLAYLANYDPLTGLPNRHLFQDRLKHAIKQARRNAKRVALLYLDLDHFKAVNDELGHPIGDQLLVQATDRIKQNIRESDTAARLGGDEFTVIIEQVENTLQVALVVEHLLTTLSQPYQIDSHEIFVSASIGIAYYPTNGKDINKLLKNADSAMYFAKEQGRNNYCFFTNELDIKAKDHLQLESRLRMGMIQDNFQLHFQPQIEITTGRILGAEALLRWMPEQTLVNPDHFITVLEDTGLIVPVGKWVLEKACQTAKRWQQNGFNDFRISVNVAARQLREIDIVDMIKETLQDCGLAPKYLEIELTESTLIDSTISRNNLKCLENLGVRLAIDDFGTGYTSLCYLQQYSVDTLKIDRSFINNLNKNRADDAVTAAIIGLSHTLGMEVVAEGVETIEQLNSLEKLNCNQAQGFLISRPMSKPDFEKWMSSCSKQSTGGNFWHLGKVLH
jgi:diguanylate cyclase (GGDEF)-like protein